MATDTPQPATFKSTQFLFLALLAGQFIFCMSVLFIFSISEAGESETTNDIFLYLSPLILIGMIIAAFYMRKIYQKQAAEMSETDVPIEHYRKGVIIRLALVEVANLLTLVFMLQSGGYKYYFLIFFVVGILTFLMLRPDKGEMRRWYKHLN